MKSLYTLLKLKKLIAIGFFFFLFFAFTFNVNAQTYTDNYIITPAVSFGCTSFTPAGILNQLEPTFSFPNATCTAIEYQWEYSYSNDFSTTNVIPISNTIFYYPPLVTQTIYYRRVAKWNCGIDGNYSNTSNTVTFTITSHPNFDGHQPSPASTTVCSGNTASFTSTPINTTIRRWQINTGTTTSPVWVDLNNNAIYSGVTSTTLNILNSTGLDGKEYRMAAQNIGGCPAIPIYSEKATLHVNALPTVNLTPQNISCFGGNDGGIAIVASVTLSPYTYSTTGPANYTSGSDLLIGLFPGTYTVSVTDANNCVTTTGVTLTQLPIITATVASTDISCHDVYNGTITVSNAQGGSGTYEYSIGGNVWQSSGDFTSLVNNTYTVQIRDAAHTACVVTLATKVIANPAMLAISLTSTNVTCNGGNNGNIDFVVSGGIAPYTVVWTGPSGFTQTSGQVLNLIAGTYNVSVTDANGCIITGQKIITELPLMSATVTSTNINCHSIYDGTITVDNVLGGSGTYQYSIGGAWQSIGSFTSLEDNTYTVQIRDAAHTACVVTLTNKVISEPDALEISFTASNVTCNGGHNGEIDFEVSGGISTYSVVWTGPSGFTQTSSQLQNLSAGTYNVSVTDHNGCNITGQKIITELPLMTATVTSSNITCNGINDGTISISAAQGGSGNYEYSINGSTWVTTNNFTGLDNISYTVQMRDLNNPACIVPVGQKVILEPAVLYATVTPTNVTCNNANNGTITITDPTGGYLGTTYQFSIDGGLNWSLNNVFSGLTNATYNVQIRDVQHNLCIVTLNAALVITQPAVLIATVTPTNVTCNNVHNGIINITVLQGGYGTYEYSINGGSNWQSSGSFTGLTNATYNVQIRDAQHTECSVILNAALEITQPDVFIVDAVSSVNSICETGLITLTGARTGGNTGIVNYTWSDGTNSYINGTPFTATVTATYTVTGTDSKDCTYQDDVTVIVHPLPNPIINGDTLVCCNDATPYCDANVGEQGNFSYQWTISGGVITYGANTACIEVVWNCNCTNGWLQLTKTNLETGCVKTTVHYNVTINSIVPVINGNTTVSTIANGEVYTLASCITGHLYSWTVVGGTITSGQGTCSITVNWDWNACQQCAGSVMVTETSLFGCTGTTTIDINQIPVAGNYKIEGTISYDNIYNTPLNGVTIELLEGNNVIATTSSFSYINESDPLNPIEIPGYYKFDGLFNGNYVLRASSTKPWGGVTATDALAIKLNVLGTPALTGLPLVAADANLMSGVNATDALLLQLRIVGRVNQFVAGDWVFGNNTVTINSANVNNNIKALTTGDVNRSYVPVIGAKATEYTNLQKEGITMANVNQEIEIPIRVNDVLSLGAVTLNLSYNHSLIDVTAVNSQLKGFEYTINNGKVLVAWSNTIPVSLQANDVLLTLTVKAKDVLNSTTDLFSYANNTELADETGKILSFSTLKVSSIETDSRAYGISVYPNPFKNNAEFDYNLIESGNVKLALYNAIGQKMEVMVNEFKTAGNYKYNLNTTDLPSGVYTCEIIINGKTSDYKKVIKLVKTK